MAKVIINQNVFADGFPKHRAGEIVELQGRDLEVALRRGWAARLDPQAHPKGEGDEKGEKKGKGDEKGKGA